MFIGRYRNSLYRCCCAAFPQTTLLLKLRGFYRISCSGTLFSHNRRGGSWVSARNIQPMGKLLKRRSCNHDCAPGAAQFDCPARLSDKGAVSDQKPVAKQADKRKQSNKAKVRKLEGIPPGLNRADCRPASGAFSGRKEAPKGCRRLRWTCESRPTPIS